MDRPPLWPTGQVTSFRRRLSFSPHVRRRFGWGGDFGVGRRFRRRRLKDGAAKPANGGAAKPANGGAAKPAPHPSVRPDWSARQKATAKSRSLEVAHA
jgi:hypothetical protein